MNRFLAAAGPLVGRVLLASMFAYSGYQKLVAPGRAASGIAGKGLPYATALAYAAGALEVALALFAVLGLRARAAALVTVGYLVLVTWLFHWHPALRGDHAQLMNVLRNAGLAGGFLLLASHGAGPASVDRG